MRSCSLFFATDHPQAIPDSMCSSNIISGSSFDKEDPALRFG